MTTERALLQLPRLRTDQLAIVAHPAKRKNIAAGRRFGKSVLGGVVVANVTRQHGKAAWVVPTYKNSRPLWRWMAATFAGLATEKRVSISKSEQVITTHLGGFFAIYSEENIDSMRGEWFHVVVNDEAAKFREESRYDVIEPTVADSDGEIIDISTPRGRNWFWREHQLGLAGEADRMAFHAPTNANPMASIQRAFARAKQVMTARSFSQEWLAEFVDNNSGVFRNVREQAKATPQARPTRRHAYVIGVDWGKLNDFTVLSVIDATTLELVKVDRFNQIDYTVQLGRLRTLCELFRPGAVVVERNSIGEPLIETLIRMGLPIVAFQTTNASKTAIIDALTLAFEQRAIQILDDPVLIGELEAYEMERLPSGLLRYSAPAGLHDDCVMSLALAWAEVYSPSSNPGGMMIYEDDVRISPY